MKIYILATCILFACIQTLDAQHGVATEWSAEVQLPFPPASSSVRGFLYSNMGVFSNGKRVVFVNRQDGPKGMYYTFSYDGINWSMPRIFAADSIVVGLNSLKVITDHNDDMHLIWASQFPKALYYSKMDTALNLVVDSVRIADNPAYNSFRDMYLTNDLQGRVHVMWNEGETGKDLPESYYSRSIDGGSSWSTRTMISTADNLPSSFPRGQFNAYSGDTLAIFWRDSAVNGLDNWDIQMSVSHDGGATWAIPVVINPNINMQGDPDLVIDPMGRFHLFYHEASNFDPYWGMRILYGYSDDLGQTWQPSTTFQDTISLGQRSYLAEGSRYDVDNDVLWTFWKEEDMLGLQGGDMMAAYSVNRGLTFSDPEYVTDRSDSTIGFKSAMLLPNGGIAVNYEMPNYPVAGNFSIFYLERAPLTLSIETTYSDKSINVFPNPTNSVLYIEYPFMDFENECLLQLFDINGRLVLNRMNVSKLYLNHLEKGIYTLKITKSGTSSYTSKIVIK